MATATDIITYIGVPLAVLGVLPILYTFAVSILRQRRIRSLLLAHGHKPHSANSGQEGFLLRASPMTSLIEVEMPRYTIAPVDRGEDRYWDVTREAGGPVESATARLLGGHHAAHLYGHGHEHEHSSSHAAGHVPERVESTLSMVEEGRVKGFLRGGSWRTFYWRRLVVGRKLYRIQYEDELREPPAEIEFAGLVDFLMDWGAQLDGMGWEKLRTGGLWTPAGTVLLKVGDDSESDTESKISGVGAKHGDWVLRTSMPDDSDGILTLCVRWPSGQTYGSARNTSSLPPGWGRLRKPDMTIDQDQSEDRSSSSSPESLTTTIRSMDSIPTSLEKSTSLRFKLDSGLITILHPETHNTTSTTNSSNISLSSLSTHVSHPTGLTWFTAATSSLLTLHNTKASGSLWGFMPPTPLTTFTRKETLPCGVLVLLDLLPSTSTPYWDTTASDPGAESLAMAEAHHRRFQARLQAERLEASMPPDQARVHRANREAEDRRAQMDAATALLASRRARDTRRLLDAVGSPKLGIAKVADPCLRWLKDSSLVPKEWTLLDVVEATLWLIICQTSSSSSSSLHNTNTNTNEKQHQQHNDADTTTTTTTNADKSAREEEKIGGAISILQILDEWTSWSTAGGMKVEQYEMLAAHKRDFCLAACLVAVVHEADLVAGDTRGKAGVDMLECLRLWRNVRLG